MLYKLEKDVYIVFGNVKSVIYNLKDDYVKIIWNDKEKTKELLKFIQGTKIETQYIRALKDANLLSNNVIEKVVLKKVMDFSLLKFAWIEITAKCNFRCIHCYGNYSPDFFEEMEIDDIELVIKQLKEINIENIQVIGGEPFVLEKNKLKQILQLLKDNFNDVEVYTNGYFLDEDWIKFIKNLNIKLAISVYNHNDEIHNKITQNNLSFKKIKNSINLLEKNGIEYRLGFIKTKLNKDTTKDLLIKNLNTNAEIKIDNMRVTGRGELNLIDDEIINEKSITLATFKNLKLKSENVQKNFFHHNCFSNKFYISSNLDIYPCVMERRYSYGNLKNKNLKDILSDNCGIVNLTKDNIDECKVCEFKYLCFDCRPDSISENFKAKPYYCKYNPMKGEWT